MENIAMQNRVAYLFISPLERHLGTPHVKDGANIDDVYDSLEERLKEFSDEVLSKAVICVIEEDKRSSFPNISGCIDACRRVDARVAAEARKRAQFNPVRHGPEAEAQVIRMLTGEAGLAFAVPAAEEGWVLALKDFVMESYRLPGDGKIRLPNRTEAADIKASFLKREAQYGENGIPAAMKELRKHMLARREGLKQVILRAAAERRVRHSAAVGGEPASSGR
jgi:hypothetical protein